MGPTWGPSGFLDSPADYGSDSGLYRYEDHQWMFSHRNHLILNGLLKSDRGSDSDRDSGALLQALHPGVHTGSSPSSVVVEVDLLRRITPCWTRHQRRLWQPGETRDAPRAEARVESEWREDHHFVYGTS